MPVDQEVRQFQWAVSGVANPAADTPCGAKDCTPVLPEPVHWGGVQGVRIRDQGLAPEALAAAAAGSHSSTGRSGLLRVTDRGRAFVEGRS